ncbi:hypothetical protein [Methylobacterium sp. R2-1]|uniref:hypothetical protein n=1 Tax=Methylobacterium sp. R2-1 TaxID=2587064 RepID=UPI001612028C|nr:hypothetical protein [Methylobacterium sp. R2-1]MBB2961954.1 hypothetical protein [Methylobacterium sp. R2-1]
MSKFTYGAASFAGGVLLMLYVAQLAHKATKLGHSISHFMITDNWQITVAAAVMMIAGYQIMMKAKKEA